MRILIIGGMGLIGGAISEAATNRQMDVMIVSRRKLEDKWLKLNVKGISGNWRDDAFANSAVTDGYDVIIDTIAFTKEQLLRSLNICDGHCKQFIFISTDSVYDKPAENVSEDEKINLESLKWKYGYDKREAELELFSRERKYSFQWTIVRPTLTFGDTRIPVGFASKRNTFTLCQRIINGKPIIRFDNPNSKHTICHVSTFGSAVVGLFLNEAAYGQAYHIADDQTYTYDELFAVIEKILEKKAQFVYVSVNTLKKYNKGMYEEMIYDKNPTFTVDNSKIKNISNNAVYHVCLEDVMRSGIDHLRGIDCDYDFITDTILLKSQGFISDADERQIAERYIGGLSKEYVEILNKYDIKASVRNILHPVRVVLSKVKHLALR